ncbi:MAG TPA: tetratricopeptide repeat protein [Gemmataceae bacterium]|nr:tetratricopeptide repeat protein [Gemmataceae bacterium]
MNESASQSVASPAARGRCRYLALAILSVGVAGAAGLGWRLWLRPRPVEPPGVEPAGVDPAIFRAVERARAEVRQQPSSAQSWGRLGMILLVHQFRDEARICLARAEQLDRRDVRWPYYQALALRLSDPDAVVHLRRAVVLAEEAEETPRLLLGELLVQCGQLDEAETIFGDILKRDAHNSRAHLGLARAAFERDDLPASLTHLQEAKSDLRTRKAAQALLAKVQQRRGDRAAAEEALRLARSLPEDDPWPDPLAEQFQALGVGRLMTLARAYSLIQQDRIPEAIQLIQQSLEDYPDQGRDWVLLGRAFLRGKNVPAAEQAFRTALQKEPSFVEANFYLGVVLFFQSKPREAAPYFQRATELKPDYAQAYYNLGHCLKQQGDRPGALAAFRKAVACDPQYANARTNLGELLAEDGQIDAALEQLRRAAPDDARAKQLLESVRKRAADKP